VRLPSFSKSRQKGITDTDGAFLMGIFFYIYSTCVGDELKFFLCFPSCNWNDCSQSGN